MTFLYSVVSIPIGWIVAAAIIRVGKVLETDLDVTRLTAALAR